MGRAKGAVAALGLVLAGWPAAGIAQTIITPDVAAGRALGTTVTASGATYAIDGGTRAGANLFHSFSRFDLGAGDTAAWVRGAGDAGQIRNVVSRVTGGQASTIAGVIDSTALPNAAFYFVNPAGIVFGAGARVNVPSAAHFSTASDLRFADGARFAIAAPDGSTLSVAAPEAWGFVGGQGDITVTGAALDFAGSARLGFAAANVGISQSTFTAGGLDLVAVGNRASSVRVSDPLSAATGGRVTLTGSRMAIVSADAAGAPARLAAGEIVVASTSLASSTTGAGRGGDIFFRADRVAVAPDGFVITSASGSGAGGDLRVTAGIIDIDARGATTTTGFGSVASASGAAGAVALNADTIRLTGEVGNTTGSGFAFIGSTVLGTGGAGDVDLTATNVVIDVALISSTSVGDGDGGTIRLSGRNLELGGANVITSSFGAGAAGNVIINGDTIAISGGSYGATPGSRQQSGELVINARTSIEAEGGFLSAISGSPTSAGRITLRAPLILLSETNINTAAIDEGLAGQITLEADQLLLDRVFLVSDSDDGSAATGVVRLKSAGDLIMFQGFYSANVNGIANGGRIEVEGRNVLVDGAIIQTTTGGFGPGDAGQIAITAAQDLSITGAAFISSSSDSEGRAGSIALAGRNVSIDEQSLLLSNAGFSGDAGDIQITAADRLDLDTSDILTLAESGTGDGGSIRIQASRLFMADATVSSDTQTSGKAGTVSVRAGQIELDGRNRAFTSISSSTIGDGDAGSVTIDAQSLTIRNLAFVESESVGSGNLGNAGQVTIRTGDLSLLRGGGISTAALQANGGDISITATGNVTLASEPGFSSFILAVANGGDAGNIGLNVGGTLRLTGGTISSDTFGEGDAGQLTIKANTLTMASAGNLTSSISSSTGSFGDAGAVSIDARTINMGPFAQIRSVSASDADGDARSVTINADNITLGRDAIVTTTTLGRGDAGEVAITTKSLLLDGGEVSSSAGLESSGSAGNVTIAATDVAIVNEGVLSTLSGNTNRAGVVRVTATGQVTVEGRRSSISSANLADGRGDAGSVFLTAGGVRIANGGSVTTSAIAGAAGDITISIQRPGLLVLEGRDDLGVIQTSSGPGTGGRITISDPLAIISNGGLIQALGQQRGANVRIQSRYFINSTDRLNDVDVAGEIQIQTGLYDVSSGVVSRDLSVLDASKVLRGQCPATRASGAVSQLITRPVGPYAREPASDPLVMPAAPSPGGCP